MVAVTEQPVWSEVRQIEADDPVQGGAGGIDNLPHVQLANRTLYLKEEFEGMKGEPTEDVTLASLLKRVKVLECAEGPLVPVVPIGTIIETVVDYQSGTEVAEAFGYGQWKRYAEGRALVGYSTSAGDDDRYMTMGNEFGENTHTLTVEEMPAHSHNYGLSTNISGSGYPATGSTDNSPGNRETSSVGGGQPHNNIQPVKVVGRWVRFA